MWHIVAQVGMTIIGRVILGKKRDESGRPIDPTMAETIAQLMADHRERKAREKWDDDSSPATSSLEKESSPLIRIDASSKPKSVWRRPVTLILAVGLLGGGAVAYQSDMIKFQMPFSDSGGGLKTEAEIKSDVIRERLTRIQGVAILTQGTKATVTREAKTRAKVPLGPDFDVPLSKTKLTFTATVNFPIDVDFAKAQVEIKQREGKKVDIEIKLPPPTINRSLVAVQKDFNKEEKRQLASFMTDGITEGQALGLLQEKAVGSFNPKDQDLIERVRMAARDKALEVAGPVLKALGYQLTASVSIEGAENGILLTSPSASQAPTTPSSPPASPSPSPTKLENVPVGPPVVPASVEND